MSPSIDQQVPEGFVAITMDAEIDNLTKAASLGNDLSVTWATGDSLAVFDGVNNDANKFRVASVNGNVARIYGTVSASASLLTAVYPYTAATSLTSGKLTLSIPTAQKIDAGKVIDGKALVSVARTLPGSSFSFKNAVSLVKFTVAAGTSSVAVVGNASEAFVGSCTEGDEGLTAASTKLTVAAAEGTLAAGTYYAAICPTTFSTGITVAATTTEGATVKKSANSAAFVKNGGLNLGNVSNGTKIPTEIGTKDDLVTWATYRRYLPAGSTIKFTADIDLAGVEWLVPTDNFCGNIDGQNHRVYNISASSEKTGDVGLLGRIGDGATSYTVKNICAGSKDYDFTTKTGTYDGVSKFTFVTVAPVVDGAVKGTYYYPGLVTYLHKTSVLENVVNFVAIDIPATGTCNRRVGGVAGTMKDGSKIINCTNYGTITDNGTLATASGSAATLGGVVGGMDGASGTLSGDKNYGKITVNNAYNNNIAGITGMSSYANLVIENCENHGDIDIKTVSTTSDNCFGGITAYSNSATNLKITGCKNYGAIKCEPASIGTKNVYIAGIAAQINYNAATTTVSDCHNYGTITLAPTGTCAANTMLGGIVGYYGSTSGVVDGCTNEGAILKNGAGKSPYMGGIIAYTHAYAKKASFKNCVNKGAVTTCSSDSGNGFIGGVFGFTTNESAAADALTIANCNNSGAVSVGSPLKAFTYIGGVAGYFGTNTLATNCNNTALITPCTKNEDTAGKCCRVGGIGGGVAGTLTECANSGNIYCDPGSPITLIQVGGVSSGAYSPQSITKCSNTGTITVENCYNASGAASWVGAITGLASTAGKYTDCVAGGEIIVNAADSISVGGIAGLVNANTGASAVTMAEGCTVTTKITVASKALPKAGMVVGMWKTGNKSKQSFGSSEKPVKVGGSLNGTAPTTDNLATIVAGTKNVADENHVINATLAQ